MDANTQKLWRTALACWLILAVAVSVRNYLKPTGHTVYPVFVEGARHWWSGQPLYEQADEIDLFRYSPTFAVAMTPFAMLDDRLGSILWSGLGLLIYFHGLRRLVRDLIGQQWAPAAEPIFLVLALLGSLSGIWNGQSNALLIGLVMWGCSAAVREEWWPAAILWSICLLFKLHLLAVVLLFAALWPRPLVPRLAVGMLAGAALPFLTQSPVLVLQAYQDWFTQLAVSSGWRWPGFRDAWAVWELFQSPVNVPAYRAVQLASAAAVLAWCLWQQRQRVPTRLLVLRTLGMGVAWLMVFGPATEFATYVWLAPLVSWGVVESGQSRQGVGLALTAYALTMVIGCGHFDGWFGPCAALLLPAGSLLFALWLWKQSRVTEWTSRDARLPGRRPTWRRTAPVEIGSG